MKPTSQSDYTRRIERVIAAVAESLEQERELPSTATLAAIAHFSPFHFMRVYRVLAGESLGTTVQRLRLVRAAHLLAATTAPIADVSGRAGFETPQAFARAFRQHFGVAPSEARAAKVASPAAIASHVPSQPQPAIRVDVVALNPFRVVVMRTEGSYDKLDEVYRALFEWMAKHGSLEAIEGVWGVPQHDRRDTPEANYRFDCCLATSTALTASEGVVLEDLGGGNYLRYLHEGSFDRLDESHGEILRKLLVHPEWQLRDAPILHEYLNDPDETPEADLRTHIYVPVVTPQTIRFCNLNGTYPARGRCKLTAGFGCRAIHLTVGSEGLTIPASEALRQTELQSAAQMETADPCRKSIIPFDYS
jgi:AraC family transcriptional regulator